MQGPGEEGQCGVINGSYLKTRRRQYPYETCITGFSHKKHRLLKQAQVKYKSTYDQLVASYLPDSGTKGSAKPLILALEALAKSDCFRQPVQQWELQKVREQIPKLLAHLGFLFSLVQSHLINEQLETHAETVATMQAVNPHCIQVLGILGMLNIGEAHGNISNHIARVLTGQGKSWYAALQYSAACL